MVAPNTSHERVAPTLRALLHAASSRGEVTATSRAQVELLPQLTRPPQRQTHLGASHSLAAGAAAVVLLLAGPLRPDGSTRGSLSGYPIRALISDNYCSGPSNDVGSSSASGESYVPLQRPPTPDNDDVGSGDDWSSSQNAPTANKGKKHARNQNSPLNVPLSPGHIRALIYKKLRPDAPPSPFDADESFAVWVETEYTRIARRTTEGKAPRERILRRLPFGQRFRDYFFAGATLYHTLKLLRGDPSTDNNHKTLIFKRLTAGWSVFPAAIQCVRTSPFEISIPGLMSDSEFFRLRAIHDALERVYQSMYELDMDHCVAYIKLGGIAECFSTFIAARSILTYEEARNPLIMAFMIFINLMFEVDKVKLASFFVEVSTTFAESDSIDDDLEVVFYALEDITKQ